MDEVVFTPSEGYVDVVPLIGWLPGYTRHYDTATSWNKSGAWSYPVDLEPADLRLAA